MSPFQIVAGNAVLICIGIAAVTCFAIGIAVVRIERWRIEREYKALLKREQEKD